MIVPPLTIGSLAVVPAEPVAGQLVPAPTVSRSASQTIASDHPVCGVPRAAKVFTVNFIVLVVVCPAQFVVDIVTGVAAAGARCVGSAMSPAVVEKHSPVEPLLTTIPLGLAASTVTKLTWSIAA